ncbi:hypothetical protein Lser_V15G18452 [Lactuca serriola]
MVQKRHLAEKEYDVSPKHLKLEHSCELLPFLQFTKEDAPFSSDKDEACFFKPIIEVDYGFLSDKFTDHDPDTTTKYYDYTLPHRLSTSSSSSITTSEEDLKSEQPQRLLIQKENKYSYLLQHPPLKRTPIGPQYQAEIPECYELNPQHDDNEIKFIGSCVIQMPKSSTSHDKTVGRGRTDCFCKNTGSFKCIQQHIKEARETLKGTIGNKKFEDLGFGNMGESVANKWSEEDEHLFHEVVYSNPVSFGKNFWNHLSEVFPSRSIHEIVSYYFNVFMLRIRAEQNRFDPMNADSDDDEWQGSDESEETDRCDSGERRNGIEDSVVDEFFEPSDHRVWDVGYFSCSRTKSDFLPTGSMIEEVFGVESWNFDDDKNSN